MENFYKDFVIVVNSENLYSSICDAINLIHLFCEKFCDLSNIFVITNCEKTTNMIQTQVNTKFKTLIRSNVEYISSSNLIKSLEQTIKSINNNFMLCLSSHGYANGDKNYINWCHTKITDQHFHDVLTNNMKKELYCLSLIDTCKSGTMLNLNYKTKDLIKYEPENLSDSTLNIVCIGAVDDNEYDQDDLSDFGYGGGLTSAFIDFMHGNEQKTIKNFFIYYKHRTAPVGVNPVLSVNVINSFF